MIGRSEQNQWHPQVVAVGSMLNTNKYLALAITKIVLGLFVFYDLFPWLTAGLRDCMNYCQCLSVITMCLAAEKLSVCPAVQIVPKSLA